MEVTEIVEEEVLTARDEYLADHPPSQLHHLTTDIGALWPKLDHLLYLPILGLTRPRDLYYYQGEELEAIYGFTYKYMTMEHFLGQLTRVRSMRLCSVGGGSSMKRTWTPKAISHK